MMCHVTCLAFSNTKMTDYNTNIEKKKKKQGFDRICIGFGLQFMNNRPNIIFNTQFTTYKTYTNLTHTQFNILIVDY